MKSRSSSGWNIFQSFKLESLEELNKTSIFSLPWIFISAILFFSSQTFKQKASILAKNLKLNTSLSLLSFATAKRDFLTNQQEVDLSWMGRKWHPNMTARYLPSQQTLSSGPLPVSARLAAASPLLGPQPRGIPGPRVEPGCAAPLGGRRRPPTGFGGEWGAKAPLQ